MHITNPRTGVQQYYNERGSGDKTVILIHGWTGNHTRWGKVGDFLAKKYRVIDYDQRGHGWSDKTPGLDYSFSSYVLDLHGLMEATGTEKAIIAGHSMGGMIAQHFALAFPEKVEKLALLGTTCHVAPTKKKKDRVLLGAWVFANIFDIALYVKDRHKRETPELYPDVADRTLQPCSEAASQSLTSIANLDLRERLKDMKIPTLIIGSDTDETVTYDRVQVLAQCISHAKFVTLKGFSHHFAIETPEEVATALDAFISEQ